MTDADTTERSEALSDNEEEGATVDAAEVAGGEDAPSGTRSVRPTEAS